MTNSKTLTLSELEANRAWQYVLAKQGVGVPARFSTPVEVARATLGLHAARVASPYVTAATRIRPDAPSSIGDGLSNPELVTVRCMRRTLHSLPVDLAALCHDASVHYRVQHVKAQARHLEVSWKRLEEIAYAVVALLMQHPHLSHREIERAVSRSTSSSIAEARLALKLAWETGDVVYRNRSASWHQEARTFQAAAHVPGFETGRPSDEAQVALLQEYFHRYGPATIRDATWWSGLSQNRAREALAGLDVVAVMTPWTASPAYVLRQDLNTALSHETSTSEAVQLLAHEDVALKAYFETRRRYMGDLPARAAFNAIGEAVPVILRSGRVIGRWAWDSKTRSVRVQHEPGITPEVRRQSRAAASVMRDQLRLGHRTVE